MTNRIRAIVVLILAAALTATGCRFFDKGQPEIQRWGGLLSELRVQWNAEPGIDLLAGPAVPVRAYMESRLLAEYMGGLQYAYPGFTDAVAPDEMRGVLGTGYRQPNVNYPTRSALVGNVRYRILSVRRSGRDLAIALCNYPYGIASQQNGTFASAGRAVGDTPGVYAMRVDLTSPAGEPSPPLPPQAGPAPAPGNNVFGGWQITGFLNDLFTSDSGFETAWPTYDADRQACIDKAPDPPERRAFLIDGEHPRSDFPTAPPDPGWPTP